MKGETRRDLAAALGCACLMLVVPQHAAAQLSVDPESPDATQAPPARSPEQDQGGAAQQPWATQAPPAQSPEQDQGGQAQQPWATQAPPAQSPEQDQGPAATRPNAN
ncbi:MAG: hypothetical protein MUC55_10870 [Burkholderiales bacterium]|nr:hypothetical protein [Burkholderiales bacterium]